MFKDWGCVVAGKAKGGVLQTTSEIRFPSAEKSRNSAAAGSMWKPVGSSL